MFRFLTFSQCKTFSAIPLCRCSFTLVWERYISEFSRDVWLGLSNLLLHCVRLGSLYFWKAFFHIFQSTQRSNDVWQEQTLLSGSFRRTKVKDRFCTTEQRVFSFLTKTSLIYWWFFPFIYWSIIIIPPPRQDYGKRYSLQRKRLDFLWKKWFS